MKRMLTKTQVSAGGVVVRERDASFEVALISVGEQSRWQLPKGIVGVGETNETAALREVREETGLTAQLLAPLDHVEYWYVSNERGERVRFHKFVYFYLLRYTRGDVRNHDREVNEARWFDIEEAVARLAFANERRVLERARDVLRAMPEGVAPGVE